MRIQTTLLLPFLLGSCGSTTSVCEGKDPSIKLEFPDAGDDGVVPFKNGGELVVRVELDACGLEGPAKGRLRVTADEEEGDDDQATSLTLADSPVRPLASGGAGGEPSSSEDLRVETKKLSFPAGGDVALLVETLGTTETETIRIEKPQLQGSEPRLFWSRGIQKAEFCFTSNASSGSVAVDFESSGGEIQTVSQPLKADACGDASEMGVRIVRGFESSTVNYIATLVGTKAKTERAQVSFEDLGDLGLSLSADPNVLPAAGEVVTVTIAVTQGGETAPGVRTSLSISADGTFVTPSSAVTGEDGSAELFFIAPAQNELVLVATAGSAQSEGLVLRRP